MRTLDAFGALSRSRDNALALWFNPSWQLSTRQLPTPSLQWDGGENQKGKSEKTCEWR